MPLSRSEQMARIRGTDTKPEKQLRGILWRAGFRYRLTARTPLARPDLAFPRARVAVFLDGCFWHGCPEHYVRPRSREAFWAVKLSSNVLRDIRQTRELEGRGWRICRVWEHEIFEHASEVVGRVREAVSSPVWTPPLSWRALSVTASDAAPDHELWVLRELRGRAPDRSLSRRRTTTKWRVPARRASG